MGAFGLHSPRYSFRVNVQFHAGASTEQNGDAFGIVRIADPRSLDSHPSYDALIGDNDWDRRRDNEPRAL